MDAFLGQQQDRTARLAVMVVWAAVILLAVFAYWPGLGGPFLMDDFGTIAKMGDYGGVTDWETFKLFVFGRDAGPVGRPMSMLSFLIDANNWPADAWPFKRTNLVIHLLNGMLLGVLVTQILTVLEARKNDIRWIALVAAAIWMLHPFLVSTTLYVVQRMAQLSTLFIFAGLASYLYGRSLLAVNVTRAYLVMSVAVGVFTVLATLAKENGALLPVLVGVIELTVMASQRHRLPQLNHYWAAFLIVLPAVMITLYLGARVLRTGFFEDLPLRDFNLLERVLTQGRVLVDYLQHWYLPKLYTTGVFQDHFLKSTSLFSPVTTALSFVFHGVVIALAFARRRQYPLFSLAVLFFYASHLLESTVLNLELYFEHRNYVAAAFLFLPLVELLQRKANPRVFGMVALVAALVLASFTRYSATVWQSLPSMVETTAFTAPTSARAQSQYARLLSHAERHAEAVETIDRAIENIPGDNQLLLVNRLYLLCSQNRLGDQDFESTAGKLTGMTFDTRILKVYNDFLKEVVIGSCPNIAPAQVEVLLSGMLEGPRNSNSESRQYSHLQFLLGYTRTYSGRPDAALDAFEKSLDALPSAEKAMAMAQLMASAAHGQEALALSERALRQLEIETAESPRRLEAVKASDIRAFQEAIRGTSSPPPGVGISDPAD